jgi:hypothetical protein
MGFRASTYMRQDAGSNIEFVVLMLWESMDAIRISAGENAEVAVVAPSAQASF